MLSVNDNCSNIKALKGDAIMNILYTNIRERRKSLNMSQETLAEKVGYTSRSTIARIENGEIDLPQSKIMEFARALKCTPSFLMGWLDDAKDVFGSPTTIYDELQPYEQKIMERVQYLNTGNQMAVLTIINQLIDAQIEENK